MKKLATIILTTVFLTACGQPVADVEITGENTAKLLDYSEENLAAAIENNETPVLYFYADWCPTCRVFNNQLLEEIERVPEEVTILKIDFDTGKELKKEHKITIQHTLIQLDNNQNEVTRWIGGGIDLMLQELDL